MEINDDIKKANMNPQVKYKLGEKLTFLQLSLDIVTNENPWKDLSQKMNEIQATFFYLTF